MIPSEHIDRLIADLTDWRGKTLASIRKIILEADREIVEEWKWMGSPAWSRDGIVAFADAHKGKVKLTFAHGASLSDPDKLFNAGLEGNARRAIDFFEGDKINERALEKLVLAAIDYNRSKPKGKSACGRESERSAESRRERQANQSAIRREDRGRFFRRQPANQRRRTWRARNTCIHCAQSSKADALRVAGKLTL